MMTIIAITTRAATETPTATPTMALSTSGGEFAGCGAGAVFHKMLKSGSHSIDLLKRLKYRLLVSDTPCFVS